MIGRMNHRPAQESKKYSEVTVVMPEADFPRLFVRVGVMGKSLVPVLMMTEVLHGLPCLVSAIIGNRRPGCLEREQAQHEDHNKASHNGYCNLHGRDMSMTKQGNSVYRPF